MVFGCKIANTIALSENLLHCEHIFLSERLKSFDALTMHHNYLPYALYLRILRDSGC